MILRSISDDVLSKVQAPFVVHSIVPNYFESFAIQIICFISDFGKYSEVHFGSTLSRGICRPSYDSSTRSLIIPFEGFAHGEN